MMKALEAIDADFMPRGLLIAATSRGMKPVRYLRQDNGYVVLGVTDGLTPGWDLAAFRYVQSEPEHFAYGSLLGSGPQESLAELLERSLECLYGLESVFDLAMVLCAGMISDEEVTIAIFKNDERKAQIDRG